MLNDYCAIDFGTSNSAIAIPDPKGGRGVMKLAVIEDNFVTMPTAIFYNAEDGIRAFGRAAIQAYIDGFDGRLMRSIKSILGADLLDEVTDIGHGVTVSYVDVVIHYLRYLKQKAELEHGAKLNRVTIGRPVRFVDNDDVRDAKAEAALRRAAIAAGFHEVHFQFEPIAAALDYESTITQAEIVLVADIGGGTSDFSIVRVGDMGREPHKNNRQDDILANHGVHMAGTDFDQAVNIAAIMPSLGLGSIGPASQYHRRVPSKIYFDLATWHLINTVYSHNRLIELREMRVMYADKLCYERLNAVVIKRLGHALAAKAEDAKINVAMHAHATILLDEVEENLQVDFDAAAQADALVHRVNDIVSAAVETARRAKLTPAQINTLYFTGGSTGLSFLTEKIAAEFPQANIAVGDRFASVATGLGIDAARQFSGQ
jgi:hypothetical chaperone protein